MQLQSSSTGALLADGRVQLAGTLLCLTHLTLLLHNWSRLLTEACIPCVMFN